MRRQALESLHERLVAEGLDGDELRTAFLRAVEEATQHSSIFAHEGRHVIDKRLGIDDDSELEYRAKLSEIAFAHDPRAAIAAAVLSANLGDETPHGQANLRVVRGLVGWIDEHRAEIADLDATRPSLPQLDRLSDEQLRQAVRSLDPLAGASTAATTPPAPAPARHARSRRSPDGG